MKKRKEERKNIIPVGFIAFVVLSIVFFVVKQDIAGVSFLIMSLVFLFKSQIEEIQIKDVKVKLKKVDHSLKEMRNLAVTFTQFLAFMKNTPSSFLSYNNVDKSLESSKKIQEYFPKMEKVLSDLEVPAAEIERLKKAWDGSDG